ncbi:MAG: erythromycin esterase family protein [Thermoanaerobaculia bacterium]
MDDDNRRAGFYGVDLYSLFTSIDAVIYLERVDPAHYVLIGEASHGTHEFYRRRASPMRSSSTSWSCGSSP